MHKPISIFNYPFHFLGMKLLLVLYICIVLSACTQLMFQPTKQLLPLPEKLNIVKEDFYFTSKDGLKLHGWHLPTVGKPKKTLLFLHGNAINISNHVAAIYWLPAYGYEVYIFDYRGYGNSEGEADLEGVLEDIDSAVTYVTDKVGEDNQIVVMGQSIGASMGIYALSACQRKARINAYFSVAAFSDYRQVTRDFLSKHWSTWVFQWPLSFTINNDYRPLDYIAELSPIPIYLLHGDQDEIVSVDHARKLYQAARQPKSLFILNGRHNNIFDIAENRKIMVNLLDGLGK